MNCEIIICDIIIDFYNKKIRNIFNKEDMSYFLKDMSSKSIYENIN